MPRVSVIIPVYNRAARLCETLASVFAQTFRDREIIVVDDGSSDDTPERLRAFGSRITVEHTAHAGPAAARNVGLDRARGEFVAFLDSDDLWDTLFLEKMVRALDVRPGADFAYCDYALLGDGGLVRAAYLPVEHKLHGNIWAALLGSDFLCVGAVLFRRERCDSLRFDPSLAVSEDWDFWLRLARTAQAAYVDEPLLRVRVNPSGASRDPALLYTCNLQVLANLRRDFPEDTRRFHPLVRRQTSNFHLALAQYYGSQHKPLAALIYGAQAAANRFPWPPRHLV